MAEKVKLSKDGNSIDFVQSESLPTSLKKFRQSPEIEGFYRFIYENDLQKEAFEILDRIVMARKAKKTGGQKAAQVVTQQNTKLVKAVEKARAEAPAPASAKTSAKTPAKVEVKPAKKK